MAQKFYGPWQLTLAAGDPEPTVFQRFVISGSENADGSHSPLLGGPLELPVSGAEWTVELQTYEDEAWQADRVHRATAFDPSNGLIVTLASLHPGGSWWSGPEPGLTVSCVSKDPAINPIATGTSYDFTIPGS